MQHLLAYWRMSRASMAAGHCEIEPDPRGACTQGIAALMAMSILELHDDIGRQPWGSAQHLHRSVPAMRCASALQIESNPKA
jgi:hypothetical protein